MEWHLLARVLVWPAIDQGRFGKIMRRRRRRSLPLEAGCFPGVGSGDRSVAKRPNEVRERQGVPDSENRSAGARENIEDLKLGRIGVIAARHAEVTEDELRQEREQEAKENEDCRDASPTFGIEAACDFGPPIMQAAHVCHYGSTHHDEMEMGDDEVSVMDMDIEAEGSEKQAGEAAEREQADEPEDI